MDPANIFHSIQEVETEFQKASVDLDIILTDPDFDESEDWVLLALKKLHVLGSCFAKLSHKCQTTAKLNAKLVAESINMREDLLQAKAVASSCDLETSKLVRQLHTLQLQLLTASNINSDVNATQVKERLDKELEVFREEARNQSYLKEEVSLLKNEKETLNQRVVRLEQDLYGARLAAKYLDKELAGRMQQLQLLGRSGEVGRHDKVWRQLQAEIIFHRQKTVMRACKGLQNSSVKVQSKSPSDRKRRGNEKLRKVTIHKSADEGLGISVTGGQEHGVPILVTEVHDGGVVDCEGGLLTGDAILYVNGIDIRYMPHNEAVALLTQKTDKITLEIVPSDTNCDSDDEDFVVDIEVAGDAPTVQKPIRSPSFENDRSESSVNSTPAESLSTCDYGDSSGVSPSSSTIEKGEAKPLE